ncbi:hypothetical protein V8G54_033090 [Vigna mungo]|uniref:Uncharacterized protein n=1 Tax=Vigna mungo TaxID=3915 RepID=A0AAQ3RIJ0_VIGMU
MRSNTLLVLPLNRIFESGIKPLHGSVQTLTSTPNATSAASPPLSLPQTSTNCSNVALPNNTLRSPGGTNDSTTRTLSLNTVNTNTTVSSSSLPNPLRTPEYISLCCKIHRNSPGFPTSKNDTANPTNDFLSNPTLASGFFLRCSDAILPNSASLKSKLFETSDAKLAPRRTIDARSNSAAFCRRHSLLLTSLWISLNRSAINNRANLSKSLLTLTLSASLGLYLPPLWLKIAEIRSNT